MSEFHNGDQYYTSQNPQRTVDFKGDIHTSLYFESVGGIESQSVEAPITLGTYKPTETATLVRGNMFFQEIIYHQRDNENRFTGPQIRVNYDKAYYPAPMVFVQDGFCRDGVSFSPPYNVICSNSYYIIAYRVASSNLGSVDRQFYAIVIK